MKGGRREGSGRKRKSIEQHLLNGTYRRSRHGPRPSSPLRLATQGATAVILEPVVGPAPAWILDGLAEPGRRLVTDAWQVFEGWSGAEQVLLRQAARALDDAESDTDSRGRRGAMRLFAALVQQLGLAQRT